ncbi:MAG: dockerin type I domain-containing protein, partial [Pirellula sp.]
VSIRVVDSSLPNTTFPEVTSRLSVRDLPEVQSVTDQAGHLLGSFIDSLRLNWDSLVNVSVGAIRVVKTDVAESIVSTTFVTSTINGKTVADLVFTGPNTNSGKLNEGDYTIIVDGLKVESPSNLLYGANFRSSNIRVLDPTLPGKLSLTGSPWTLAGKPFILESHLQDLPFAVDGNVDYKIDWNGDGTVDQMESGPIRHNLTQSFSMGGSVAIVVVAEKNGVKLGQNSFVVDVSTATTANEAWLSALDADRDNTISPLDALVVINSLNSRTGTDPIPYRLNQDVDRDGSISPLDVLALINYLNSDPSSRNSDFSQLSMPQSGVVPGFTDDNSISGKMSVSTRNLFISLDGSDKKDASQFVQPDGSFSIQDAAIAQMFGQIPEGNHTLSLVTRTNNRFSIAVDRRFYKPVRQLNEFQLVSALDVNGIARLKWTSSGPAVRYKVYASTTGASPVVVASSIASTEARVALPIGQYQLFIEAIDSIGRTKRTAPAWLRVEG